MVLSPVCEGGKTTQRNRPGGTRQGIPEPAGRPAAVCGGPAPLRGARHTHPDRPAKARPTQREEPRPHRWYFRATGSLDAGPEKAGAGARPARQERPEEAKGKAGRTRSRQGRECCSGMRTVLRVSSILRCLCLSIQWLRVRVPSASFVLS
jgi:hypothetical protein